MYKHRGKKREKLHCQEIRNAFKKRDRTIIAQQCISCMYHIHSILIVPSSIVYKQTNDEK